MSNDKRRDKRVHKSWNVHRLKKEAAPNDMKYEKGDRLEIRSISRTKYTGVNLKQLISNLSWTSKKHDIQNSCLGATYPV